LKEPSETSLLQSLMTPYAGAEEDITVVAEEDEATVEEKGPSAAGAAEDARPLCAAYSVKRCASTATRSGFSR
jgi:hypothetical protein